MKVLLLHLDGKLPNIALMRIAAYHRDLGDDVTLRRALTADRVEPEFGDAFDRVYASLIFDRTRPVAERLRQVRPDAIIGGTGWDVTSSLEARGITTLEQDYSIYPEFKPSIGFTQRGCRLRCDFCVVPRKEGAPRDEQTIADIWRGPGHPRDILMLDNDVFGAPSWRDRLAELRDGDYRASIIQGWNLRTLTPEQARALASIDYRDARFKERRLYTAWDNPTDEKTIFRGLERLKDAGVKPDHVMVYMLIGYWAGETHADREYRRQRIRAWGARPYPMPFARTPELLGYARWVIGAYDKTIPWAEWRAARMQPAGLGDRSGAQRALPLFADVCGLEIAVEDAAEDEAARAERTARR